MIRDDRVRQLDSRTLEQTIQRRALLYDKSGEEHYNLISALHKSMRNSDPTPRSTGWRGCSRPARIRSTSRGGSCASPPRTSATPIPQALTVAVAAKDAAHFIGMPEGNTALAQAAIYPRHRAEEQRRLPRLQRRRGRRAHAGRRAGAAAPAQRADEA